MSKWFRGLKAQLPRRNRSLAGLALIVAFAFALPQLASAATTVVQPNSMGGWTIINEDLNTANPAPQGTFVNGPKTPPLGVGSFRQVAQTGDKQGLGTNAHNGLALSSISALSYSTYTTAGGPSSLTGVLKFDVDKTGDGTVDTILVFEPYEQHGFNSSLPATRTGEWQTWETMQGGWWSKNDGGVTGPRKTLAQWAADFGPNAKIASAGQALRIEAGSTGSSWPNFDGNIDNVIVNGTTYDFEALAEVVWPGETNGWTVVNQDLNAANGNAPSGSFVNGPAAPPAGYGSFRQLAKSGDKTGLATMAYSGASLASLNPLSYSTYVTSSPTTALTPALKLEIDKDGNGTADTTLSFEPYEQHIYQAGIPTVQTGTWQTWNAAAGVWSSTKDVGQAGPRQTLAEWNTQFGGAAQIATLTQTGVMLEVGSTGASWPDVDVNFDKVTIGATTYDMEAYVPVVNCDNTTNDILAVQSDIDGVPGPGATISLAGTCDFSAAPAHGGDVTSNPNTAVLIGTGNPINGLTIESAGDPQPATILGSGTQTAFLVGPGNNDVTIRGLTFTNVGRAVVAINTEGTTIGAPGGVPSEDGNRIIGMATTDSAVLGLANDRDRDNVADQTVTIKYGSAGTPRNFAIPLNGPGSSLANFSVLGNYISFNPPGVPNGTTEVIAVDVRQRAYRIVDGVDIKNNAIGYFAYDFPSTNQNAIKIHSLTPGDNSNDYYIKNVAISGNNLGRLEEIASLSNDAADVHAAGRLGINLIGVNGFSIEGNGVRTRISSTGAPMPGGGIVVSDSANGRIESNGIIVIASPDTENSDLGAIGVVDDMGKLFAGSAKPQASRSIVVRDNTIGPVGQPVPNLGAQRGLVLNGSSDVSAYLNNFKYTSADAVNIAATVQGPGGLDSPGIQTLAKTVTASTVCGNKLDGVEDNASEVSFGSDGSANYFPSGGTFPGNNECAAPPASLSTSPANGAQVKTSNAGSTTATYDRDLQSPPDSDFLLKDKTGTPVSGSVALSGPTSVSGGKRSISFTPDEPLTEAASPYTARVTAMTAGSGATTTEFSFTIDNQAPAAPTIATPAEGSLTKAQPVHVTGSAELGSTVSIFEGTTLLAGGPASDGSYDVQLPFGIENDVAHIITATATDSAGNQSPASGARSFRHDSKAPDAPAITSPIEGAIIGLNTFTLVGTAAEPGTIVLYEGANEVGQATTASTDWSLTLYDVSDGSHTYTAKELDDATNTSAASNARTVVVDTTAPGAPTVSVSPTPINAEHDNNLTVSGSAEKGSAISIGIDDSDPLTAPKTGTTTADGTTGAYSLGALDVSGLDDGPLTVTVESKDTAENKTTTTISVDKDATAPDAPTVQIAPDPVNNTNKGAVTVSGTGEELAVAHILVTSSAGTTKVEAETSVDSLGNYSATVDVTSLADGTLTADVKLTDAFGNQGAPGTKTATKDIVAPSAPPTISNPAANEIVASTTLTVSGAAEPSATVEVSDEKDQSSLGTATANAAGNWSKSVTMAPGDGRRKIGARQTDAAGNPGTASTSVTFVVDTEAPSIVSTSPADGVYVPSAATVEATYSEELKSGTMQVRNRLNTLIGGTVAINGSTVVFTPSGGGSLPESGSPYAAKTTGTDYANRMSAVKEFAFGVSATPTAVTMVTDPVNAANQGTTSASGTAPSGVTVSVVATDGTTTTPTKAATATGTDWSVDNLDVSGLADGVIAYVATATDPAGNTVTASKTATKDATIALVLSSVTDPVNSANKASTSAEGTTEAGATVSVVATDGTTTTPAKAATVTGTDWLVEDLDVSALADGEITYRATASDAAGNIAVASKKAAKDTVAPAGTVEIVDSDNFMNAAETAAGSLPANWSGTTGESATIWFEDSEGHTPAANCGPWENVAASGSGSVNGACASELPEGAFAFKGQWKDAAGNVSTIASAGHIKDTSDPTVAVTTVTDPVNSANKASTSASGTTEVGATVSVVATDGTTTTPAKAAVVTGTGWSATGIDVSALADGEITYRATATDAAGNTAVASKKTAKDTSDPAVAVTNVTDPVNSANKASTSASGTTEAGATVSVVATDGTTTTPAKVATVAGTGWSATGIDVSGLSNGTITYRSTATDAAGNTAVATKTATKDTATPAVAVTTVTDPVNSANKASTSASGTTEAGATVSVVATDGTTTTPAKAATVTGTTWSVSGIDVSSLADGPITYRATATDAVGNTATASKTATKDIAAVLLLSKVTDPVNSWNKADTSAEGTTEAGATVTVVATDGTTTTPAKAATVTGTTWSVSGIDVSGLSDGEITYRATATDAAGNTAVASKKAAKDTVAPTAPTIARPAADAVLLSSSVTIEGTAESGSEVSIYEGLDRLGVTTATGGTWSVVLPFADGSHTISVIAGDVAGNFSPTSTRTFSVVTHAPSAPVITSPAEDAALPDDSVTIAGTASPGSTLTVKEGTTTLGTPPVDSSGNWSLTQTFEEGSHTITATASNPVGSSPATSRTFNVDLTAPDAPDVTSPVEGAHLTTPSVTVEGTAEEDAVVTIKEGTATLGTTGADSAGKWAFTQQFTEGAHAISVTATDAAGNVGEAVVRNFAIDSTAPAAGFTTENGALYLPGSDVIVEGTAQDAVGIADVTVDFIDATGTVTTVTAVLSAPTGTSVPWTAQATGLLSGPYTVNATATDTFGNKGTVSSITIVVISSPLEGSSAGLRGVPGKSSASQRQAVGPVTESAGRTSIRLP